MNRQRGPAVAKTLPFTPVLLRPLPRPVAPFPNETLNSYRQRLATANELPNFRAVRTPSRWLLCQLDELEKLELLSGQSRRSLLWAIPDLRHFDPAVAPEPPSTRSYLLVRRACDLCGWRSGSGGEPIYVHLRGFHDNVCVRHRRWLACGKKNPEKQISLERAPEVVRAQVTLDRLAQKYQERAFGLCYQLCERFWVDIDHRALVRKDCESTFERIYLPDAGQLPNRFGPVERFRRAASYPHVARLSQLVMGLSLQSELERKSAHITGDTYARFEESFQLDFKPRTSTAPWIRSMFNSLVEATSKYTNIAEVS